jgi:hypothetical protein
LSVCCRNAYLDPTGLCSVGSSEDDLDIGLNEPAIDIPDLNFAFSGDDPFIVADSSLLDADSILDANKNSLGPYKLNDLPNFGTGVDGYGAAGLGLGYFGYYLYDSFSKTDNSHEFTQTGDGSKVITPIDKIIGGFKDVWNELFNPNNINLGTYTPKVDPFNVETFPGKNYSDDFSNRDIFTFPDAGNIKVKDYIETFPKGVHYWLESIFFESKTGKDTLPDLPSLDSTGKVHGDLPKSKDLNRYSNDELIILRDELKQSVQERIRKNTEYMIKDGPPREKRGHQERQNQEQELIQQIDRHLEH